MNTKFNIQLNCYPHCLLYEANDEIYQDTKERISEILSRHPDFDVDEDDFVFDDEEYERDCKDAFIKEYRYHMPDIVLSLGDAELDKPREYRCFHRGDYCYADVELCENWLDVMKSWIEEHKEWFSERIVHDWTSRDGFWSFISTSVDGWIEYLENEDERYVGHMLYYMAYVDDEDFNMGLDEAIYEIYAGCYNHLSEEKDQELYDLEHQPGWDMTNQTEIDFSS